MTDHLAYFGTNDGVLTMRRLPGNWEEVAVGLKGHEIRTLAHRSGHPQEIFAGSYGRGLSYSTDAGQTWQPRGEGIPFTHIRSILIDPNDSQTILVGTEPAAVFRSDDGGRTWHELATVRQLPGHERWYLPYAPRAGAVRTLVAVPATPGTYYGGIEQGGVIFTYDGGNTWQLLEGGVHPDVHQLLLVTNGGSILFAATGGGIYRSWDGGKTWEQVWPEYTRAIGLRPDRTQILYAGPAQQVGHLGQIIRTQDAGSTWAPWNRGLTIPLPGMVEQFATRAGHLDTLGGLFAVLSGGEVHHCDLDHADWVPILGDGVPHVNCLELAVG